jgi:hypothetical protein
MYDCINRPDTRLHPTKTQKTSSQPLQCGSHPHKTFTLHVDRSLHPNINGTDQKRFFSISGDEMKVNSPPFKYEKGTFTGYFIWARAK